MKNYSLIARAYAFRLNVSCQSCSHPMQVLMFQLLSKTTLCARVLVYKTITCSSMQSYPPDHLTLFHHSCLCTIYMYSMMSRMASPLAQLSSGPKHAPRCHLTGHVMLAGMCEELSCGNIRDARCPKSKN